MSLPVSADYPLVPFMQYDGITHPPIPGINVDQSVAHLLPNICSAIANELGLKANANKARMFCYNLLVNNNWFNAEFAEVVKLVSDLVALNYKKRLYHLPEAGINDAISQVLTLYSSDLLFRYPGLKGQVSPQILNAAQQNSQVFNNLKQELASMHNYNNGYPQQMQPMQYTNPQPMHGMQPVPYQHHQNVMHPNQYPNGMQMQSNVQMPPGYAMGPNGPVWVGNMPPVVNNYPMQQTAFAGGAQYVNPAAQQPAPTFANNGSSFGNNIQAGISNNATFDIKQDRFLSRQAATNQTQQQQQTQQPPVQRETVQEPKQQYLTIDKGSEMERAKHQIVLFGNSYNTDILHRTTQLVTSTNELAKEDPSLEPSTNQYVQGNILLEPCIESAIIAGRSKQFEKQSKDSSINVFRCFAVVATPIVCVDDVSTYTTSMLEATNFTSLAVKMKALAMSLATKKQDKPMYTDSIISFMKNIDNQLTTIVNGFMRNSLKVKIRIENFSDDIGELHNYLYRKFGSNYSDAFNMFEADLMLSIREQLNESSVTNLMSHFELPEGLNFTFLPVNHSLTFTFMLDSELGYKVGDEPVVIDKSVAPSLYKIAESLCDHKKQMEMFTVHDLLITADDVRYKLYRNRTVTKEYLIARA